MSSGSLGRSNIEDFWGEMAPCDHFIQIYDDQGAFLDALEGFIAGGLRAGDSTIGIATAIHLNTLEQRMRARGDQAATVRLEHLWNQLCQARGFSLFCAYPKVGFTQDANASISELCAAHSRVISAN